MNIKNAINNEKEKLIDGIFNDGLNIFKNKIVYTVDLTKKFCWLEPWLYKNCNMFVKSNCNKDDSAILNNQYEIEQLISRNNNSYQIFIIEGVPILLSLSFKISNGDGFFPNLKIQTINNNKCKKILNRFIKKMIKENKKLQYDIKSDRYFYFHQECCYHDDFIYGKKIIYKRTFNDVFIPEKDKKEIKNILNKYKSKYNWYKENNLINHFGILLYGEPGTGKSSLAQAIANYLKAQIYIVNGDNIFNISSMISSESFNQFPMDKSLYRVIIVEDIDAGLFKYKTDKEKDKKENEDSVYGMRNNHSIGEVLNILDGIKAPFNTIYIFTTNRVEKLDPALIRPGRIDYTLEVKNVNNETLNQFTKKFYKKETPIDLKIKKGLTFAELQTLVMIDTPFEEFLKKIKA